MTTTSGSVYYHHDGLGNTIAITNGNAEVLERYSYDVFGRVNVVDASTGNSIPQSAHGVRHFYTGHDFQAELGLILTHYRAYDPRLGRWLSRDPIGENGGVNLYGYVGNGPVNAVDPLGLMIFFVPTQSTPVLGLPQAYEPARGIRTQGHQQFPGPANSAQRHQWAAQQSASQFGTTNARLLGIGNELQGLFLHDLTNLESRLDGTSPWAFQVEDLLDNEVGFDRAREQRRRDCEEQQRQRQQNPPPPPPQRPWWQNLFFPVLA
jgi:RHS repeat-associated protein